MTARMARGGNEANTRADLRIAVDELIVSVRELDPFRDRVLRLRHLFHLVSLHVDGDAPKQLVVPTVVEVQMRVDDGNNLVERQPATAHSLGQRHSARAEVALHLLVIWADSRVHKDDALRRSDRENENRSVLASLRMAFREMNCGDRNSENIRRFHERSSTSRWTEIC